MSEAEGPAGAARLPLGPIVVASQARHAAAAEAVARRLGARIVPPDLGAAVAAERVVLWYDDRGLGLRGPPRGARARHPPQPPAGGRAGPEPLVRALGGDPQRTCVVDATAGWGVDAGVMVAAGAWVTMVERSPLVASLLGDALERWRAEGAEAAGRLELIEGEARDLLAAGVVRGDVVYLDPFYPGREQHATTAAELSWLRAAVGDEAAARGGPFADPPSADRDADEAMLLAAARAAARRRVVVKRPLRAPPLAGVAPSGSLRGSIVRFDLYAPGSPATPLSTPGRAP